MSRLINLEGHVERVQDLTHDVRVLRFRWDEPPEFAFEAGQYVSWRFDDPETGRPFVRPYSIASPPSFRGGIELVIKIVEGGRASRLIATLRGDERVTMKGPYGRFLIQKAPGTEDVVFVATGTGVAPFRSMALDEFERNSPLRFRMLFGVRHEEDVFWADDMAAWKREHPNFDYVITLSQPRDGWTGGRGRVTKHLRDWETLPPNAEYYLCGGSAMIDEVTAILAERGVPKERVFRELFFKG